MKHFWNILGNFCNLEIFLPRNQSILEVKKIRGSKMAFLELLKTNFPASQILREIKSDCHNRTFSQCGKIP